MKTLIVIAEEGERKLISQYLNGSEATEVLVTGVGALNVIRSLSAVPRDTYLINIGYCGSANFAVGSVTEVKEARLNHPNVDYDEPTLPLIECGLKIKSAEIIKDVVCYSNTDFVLQSDYKDCVFDMELAYIAALGFQKVSAVKIVSDNLSLHNYREVANGVNAIV